MKKLIFSSLLVVFSVWSVVGQNHPALSSFTYIKERNQVILVFVLKLGASCNGVGIFRSIDKENYDLIGQIEGVCGSSDQETTYTYVDENPDLSGPNYYELSIGFQGKTEPPLLVEYFKLAKGGLGISPNPTTYNGTPKVRWLNPEKDLCVLKVYSPNGTLIHTEDVSEEEFYLNEECKMCNQTDIGGIYLITVENTVTGERFEGKWLKTAG